MSLIPEFTVPDFINKTLKNKDESTFKKSLNFNFVVGDIETDGTREIATSGFLKAYNDWVVKVLSTERGVYDFYPDWYGVDIEEVFLMNDRKKQEMALEKTITDAIFADEYKRAKYVNEFEFVWDTDSVEVRFKIFTDEGEIPIIYNVERR